jgi:hypothetical protein
MYFIVVSAQRIVSRLIVIYAVDDPCFLNAEGYIQIEAATFMWDCTVLSTGTFTIAGDVQANHTPTRRRWSYCFLALCVLIDAFGSYIWGNSMASQVSVSLGFFDFFLDNQITSSITSQAIIALHFLFVSFRSPSGRGWAYASLRFEFDCREPLSEVAVEGERETLAVADRSTVAFESGHEIDAAKHEAAMTSNAFSRLRQRVVAFQKRHLLRCCAFVIPRVSNHDADIEFVMARPAFDFRILRPLQRLADNHPKSYIIFSFWFLILPNFVIRLFVRDPARGVSSLVFNFGILTMLLGYLSSRRHGLDRVAVKHVTLSFRFAVCLVLLAQWVALSIRDSYNGQFHPAQTAGDVFLTLVFLGCALLDCSPHLSTSSQIVVTVTLS